MESGSVRPHFLDLDIYKVDLVASRPASLSFRLHGHSPFLSFMRTHSLAVSGVVTRGVGVKCQSHGYDIGSRLPVCDGPRVRILCYTGVLSAVNM